MSMQQHRPGDRPRSRLRGRRVRRRGTSCSRARRRCRAVPVALRRAARLPCALAGGEPARAGSTRRCFRRSTPSSPRCGTASPAARCSTTSPSACSAPARRSPRRWSIGIPLGLFMGQVRAVEARARSDPAGLPPDLGAGALPGVHPAARARRGLEGLRDLLGDAVPAAAQHDRRRQGGRPQADRDGARLRRLAGHGVPPRRAARRRCRRSSSGCGCRATTALLLLIASEMIGANKGVGFQVMNAQYNFQIPLMFAAIFLLAGARPHRQLRAGRPAAAALPLERRRLTDCRSSHPPQPQGIDHDNQTSSAFPRPGAVVARRPASRRRRASPRRRNRSRSATSPARAASRRTNWPMRSATSRALGVELENVGYASGGPDSLFALASGSLDLGSAATAAVINSIAGGNDFVAAYPSNGINDQVQSIFYVLEDSPIKSLSRHRRQDPSRSTRSARISTTRSARRCTARPAGERRQPGRGARAAARADAALGARSTSPRFGYWQTHLRGRCCGRMAASAASSTTPTCSARSPAASSCCAATSSRRIPRRRATSSNSPPAPPTGRARTPRRRARCSAGILEQRGENAEIAQYWRGFGLREGAQPAERDLGFWIEVLEREGNLPKGKLQGGRPAVRSERRRADRTEAR